MGTESITNEKTKQQKQYKRNTTFFNWHMHKIGPRKPKYNIFGDQFYSENCQKAQIRYAPLFLCKKTYDMINLPEVKRIYKKLQILFQFSSGPRGSIIRTKFKTSCEFSSL